MSVPSANTTRGPCSSSRAPAFAGLQPTRRCPATRQREQRVVGDEHVGVAIAGQVHQPQIRLVSVDVEQRAEARTARRRPCRVGNSHASRWRTSRSRDDLRRSGPGSACRRRARRRRGAPGRFQRPKPRPRRGAAVRVGDEVVRAKIALVQRAGRRSGQTPERPSPSRSSQRMRSSPTPWQIAQAIAVEGEGVGRCEAGSRRTRSAASRSAPSRLAPEKPTRGRNEERVEWRAGIGQRCPGRNRPSRGTARAVSAPPTVSLGKLLKNRMRSTRR